VSIAEKVGFICLVFFMFIGHAHAHKLNMFAFEEENQIFVEGYFSDGVKPKVGKVSVLDNAGNVLLTGETDEDGGYIFPKPSVNEYRIELVTGLGHKTALGMKAGEVVSKDESKALGIELEGSHAEEISAEETNSTPEVSTDISNAELRSIVKQAVAEATRPLAREISELKNKTGLSDIVGGIGFILGLLGIFAYLKARKG